MERTGRHPSRSPAPTRAPALLRLLLHAQVKGDAFLARVMDNGDDFERLDLDLSEVQQCVLHYSPCKLAARWRGALRVVPCPSGLSASPALHSHAGVLERSVGAAGAAAERAQAAASAAWAGVMRGSKGGLQSVARAWAQGPAGRCATCSAFAGAQHAAVAVALEAKASVWPCARLQESVSGEDLVARMRASSGGAGGGSSAAPAVPAVQELTPAEAAKGEGNKVWMVGWSGMCNGLCGALQGGRAMLRAVLLGVRRAAVRSKVSRPVGCYPSASGIASMLGPAPGGDLVSAAPVREALRADAPAPHNRLLPPRAGCEAGRVGRGRSALQQVGAVGSSRGTAVVGHILRLALEQHARQACMPVPCAAALKQPCAAARAARIRALLLLPWLPHTHPPPPPHTRPSLTYVTTGHLI